MFENELNIISILFLNCIIIFILHHLNTIPSILILIIFQLKWSTDTYWMAWIAENVTRGFPVFLIENSELKPVLE